MQQLNTHFIKNMRPDINNFFSRVKADVTIKEQFLNIFLNIQKKENLKLVKYR